MGGAGGHMWHPFDCPDVNSGQDLISFFQRSIDSIKRNPAALKIDGVNLSFRLKESPGAPSGYEFVIDRGSMKPLDVEGVTADNADQRFITRDGSPHGMVEATRILLDIFNAAVPEILPELEQLGMTQNTGPFSLYFNTEFVLKKINVKEYPFNFIAIHGVNKFVQKGPKSRKGVAVKSDQGILDQIKDKVQDFANKRNFKVYTSIPAAVKNEVLLQDALNEQFTIVYKSFAQDPEEPGELGAGEGSTKPLKAWLLDVNENPVNKKVNISQKMREIYPNMGRSQTPYAKNIYLEVLKGTAVSDIAEGPEDIESIVDAVVVMHSTRILGNAVLDALESDEFGSARDQEGVVVKDPEICGGTAFKFTGDFIVGGLASTFEEAKFRTGPLLESYMPEPVNLKEQENNQFVLLVPGGFKPPTGGHYHMIKHYDKRPDIRKIFVVTGPKPRDGVTLEQSKEIFAIYGGFSDKVQFLTSDDATPLTTCYELIKDENFVNQFPNAQFSIGASDKEGDAKRINQFVQYFQKNPNLAKGKVAFYEPAPAHSVGGAAASASRMRKAFMQQDWETFKKLLPHEGLYDNVVQILSNTQEKEEGELQENFFTMDSLFSLVNEVYSEKQRKFMCAQMDKPADERPKGLSAAEAEEMCKSKGLKEELISEQDVEEEIRQVAASLVSRALAKTPIANDDAIAKREGRKIVDKVTDIVVSSIERLGAGDNKEAEDEAAKDIYQDIGNNNLEEMSAMGAGAVAGYAGPIGVDEDERKTASS